MDELEIQERVERVAKNVGLRSFQVGQAEQLKDAKATAFAMLVKDLGNGMDTGEFLSKLKKCTRVEITRKGRMLLLHPQHTYNTFWANGKYAALVDRNSEKLPELQFTGAVIRAVRMAIANWLRISTNRQRKLWFDEIANEFEFGTKAIGVQKRILPEDSKFSRFLSERFGDPSRLQQLAEQAEQEAAEQATEVVESR